MKIKGDLLEATYASYQAYGTGEKHAAVMSYSGTVYKELEFESYSNDEINYVSEHLTILSALYGVLEPFAGIEAYRLDMKMKALYESLYKFWIEVVNTYYSDQDLIINLASSEFSKLIKRPMLTIDFKECKDGKYKSVSAYAKKARGAFLNEMIKGKLKTKEDLEQVLILGYKLNADLSSEDTLIYTR